MVQAVWVAVGTSTRESLKFHVGRLVNSIARRHDDITDDELAAIQVCLDQVGRRGALHFEDVSNFMEILKHIHGPAAISSEMNALSDITFEESGNDRIETQTPDHSDSDSGESMSTGDGNVLDRAGSDSGEAMSIDRSSSGGSASNDSMPDAEASPLPSN